MEPTSFPGICELCGKATNVYLCQGCGIKLCGRTKLCTVTLNLAQKLNCNSCWDQSFNSFRQVKTFEEFKGVVEDTKHECRQS